MRFVGTLFVAAGLSGLSACVGTDPQAALRGGSGGAYTAAAPELIGPAPRLTAVMPGELLLPPTRSGGGITPQAVPMNTAPAPRRVAARPPASVGTAEPALPPTSPFLAARLAPVDATGTPAVRPALTPLADVEAHAAVEQTAQTNRDRRFDAQIRRASSIVCSGCVPAAARRPARTAAPADATDD